MLIIFDLDGTLTPQRPTSTAPFERRLLPGVREKCGELRAAGYILAVATNQGGARQGREGRLSTGAVLTQLRWVKRELGIAACKFATKPPRKKPAPAMLLELVAAFRFPIEDVIFVGDSESDRAAAEAAGMRFVGADEFFRSKGESKGEK